MIIFNYLKSTLSSLRRRKGFAVLTIITMAFSVVSVTCVATYYALLQADLAPEDDKDNLHYVVPKMYENKSGRKLRWYEFGQHAPNTLVSDLEKLQQFGPVTIFESQQTYDDAYQNHKSFRASICQSDPGLFDVFNFNFVAGQPFRESDLGQPLKPVVINRELAEKAFGTTDCIGNILDLKYFQVKIVGVVDPVGPWSLLQRDIFMPINYEIKKWFYLGQRIKPSQQDEVAHYLDQLTAQYNKSNPDYTMVLDSMPYYEAYATIMELDFLVREDILIPLLILVLFLPGACMINLFQSLLNDRLEELGIRKALGANSGQIIHQALTESLFLIFFAGLLSLLISIPFWQMLLNVSPSIVIRDIFSWEVFFTSFIAFSLVGILIGWLSSFKLAQGSIVKYLNLTGS